MELRDHFLQAEVFEGSSLYKHLAPLIADSPQVLAFYDGLPKEKQRPVLLFAAVHYLLLSGTEHRLMRAYEAFDTRQGREFATEDFFDFCQTYSRDIIELMRDRSVQTNETNRCTGLLPALTQVYRLTHQPLALIDIGTSAGLNLNFDHYLYHYSPGGSVGSPGASVRLTCTSTGAPVPLDTTPPFTEERIGIDIAPIDVRDDDEVLWLRACVWAGNVARDQRLTAAIDLARREWVDVRKGRAAQLLGPVSGEIPLDRQLCVFSSWTLGWMTDPEQQSTWQALEAVSLTRPVWLITMESATRVPSLVTVGIDPNAMVLGLTRFNRGSQQSHVLAEIQHHGSSIHWVSSFPEVAN